MLTHKQAKLLKFIKDFQAKNDGASPSFEEMKEHLALKSKSSIWTMMMALEKRGCIKRKFNMARAIKVK